MKKVERRPKTLTCFLGFFSLLLLLLRLLHQSDIHVQQHILSYYLYYMERVHIRQSHEREVERYTEDKVRRVALFVVSNGELALKP